MTDEELLSRKPYLASLFNDAKTEYLYRYETARSGERYIVADKPLASKFSPGSEASRITDERKDHHIVIVSGAGNPIVIERILEKRKDNQICLLIDHRHDLLQFLIQNDPAVRQFAETPNCHLFSPQMLTSLTSYLSGLSAESFRGVSLLRHPGSVSVSQTFYKMTEAKIQLFFKSALSDLLTRFEFETLWLRNTLLNLRYLPVTQGNHLSLLKHWQLFWNGRPGLLVGAGPSLRRSLPLIQKLADSMLIVACDTALKPLLRYGIRPHIVHVLDAQPHTLLHLRGEDLSGIVIAADLVVHPHLTEKLKASFLFSTTTKYFFNAAGRSVQMQTPGAQMAESQCGTIGSLQSGGSVATSGFDMLRFFGASPIFMVGTDMAWTHRQLHCVGTHHYEKWAGQQHRLLSLEHINESLLQRRQVQPAQSVEDADATVPGDHVLDLYRSWFEESVQGLGDLEVWNLTAGGAGIKGSRRPTKLDFDTVIREAAIDLTTHTTTDAKPAASDLFANIPLLQGHRSNLLETFTKALQELASDAETVAKQQEFFDKYPDAAALRKKADAYIKRNEKKLTDDRRESVLTKSISKEIKRLLRWLISRTS